MSNEEVVVEKIKTGIYKCTKHGFEFNINSRLVNKDGTLTNEGKDIYDKAHADFVINKAVLEDTPSARSNLSSPPLETGNIVTSEIIEVQPAPVIKNKFSKLSALRDENKLSKDDKNKIILINGKSGAGKTRLLTTLANFDENYKMIDKNKVIVYIDIENGSGSITDWIENNPDTVYHIRVKDVVKFREVMQDIKEISINNNEDTEIYVFVDSLTGLTEMIYINTIKSYLRKLKEKGKLPLKVNTDEEMLEFSISNEEFMKKEFDFYNEIGEIMLKLYAVISNIKKYANVVLLSTVKIAEFNNSNYLIPSVFNDKKFSSLIERMDCTFYLAYNIEKNQRVATYDVSGVAQAKIEYNANELSMMLKNRTNFSKYSNDIGKGYMYDPKLNVIFDVLKNKVIGS